MGLRGAVLVMVLLPVVALVAAGGAVSLSLVEEAAERRLREDIQLIARALEPPLTRALGRDREGALQEALDSAFAFGRVYGAHVIGADGEVLAGAGRGAERMLPAQAFDAARRSRVHWEGYARSAGEPVYAYFVPLVGRGGRFEALLQITRQRSEMQDVLERIRVWGAVGIGGFALLLLSVILLGYRQVVVRPVERLLEGLRRVAAGERDHRLVASGPLELRRIADSVNGMLDALRRNEREVAHRQAVEASLRDDLKESRRLAVVGEFAAGVAHELGTPLSVVDGTAQRLSRRSDEETTLQATARIREQVGHMSDILEQLMAFARHTPPRRRDLAAGPILERALQQARERHLGLVFERQDCADEAAPRVSGDASQIEQALGYLLGNAADHAGSRVLASVTAGEGKVRFAIEDDGPGVAEALWGRCFEPFYSTRPTGEGAGLGLSVVHGIAEAHGGAVAFEDPGWLGGARVVLEIPAASEEGA